MEVKDVSQGEYADIFSLLASTTDTTTASTTDTTTVASTTDTTTQITSTTDTTTAAVAADIFGEDGKPVTKEPKQHSFKDISGYFEDRLKNKKFVALKEVDDQGNETLFVPKTPEEFDEVIDLQVNYQINKRKKEIEQSWVSSKSPAWQAVARYADLVDDPSQLIPFLQGVRVLESVKDVDENEIDGAETIVRTRLENRGDPKEVIDSQIEMLKTSNKLIDTAKQYKPLIINEEQQSLVQQQRNAQLQQQEWIQTIHQVEDAAIKAIESPIFGKQKLSKEEKAIIYDMIAMPSEDTNGYGIYTALDKLYDKRDVESMETLKQVALLLAKKDSFFTYVGSNVANKTAAELHKKLKVADTMGSGASDTPDDDEPVVIKRNSYNRAPRFGTYEK